MSTSKAQKLELDIPFKGRRLINFGAPVGIPDIRVFGVVPDPDAATVAIVPEAIEGFADHNRIRESV